MAGSNTAPTSMLPSNGPLRIPPGATRETIAEANSNLIPHKGAAGVLTLSCTKLDIELNVFAGEAQPVLTGGTGGWARVARPHRTALTDWQGVDPYTMSLAIRLDGWARGRSVETDCDDLLSMARNTSSRDGPPPVTVDGPVPLGRHHSIEFRVDEIAWGDSLWGHLDKTGDRPEVNCRVRQDVVVTLVQYVSPDTVAFTLPTVKAKAATTKAPAPKATSLKSKS